LAESLDIQYNQTTSHKDICFKGVILDYNVINRMRKTEATDKIIFHINATLNIHIKAKTKTKKLQTLHKNISSTKEINQRYEYDSLPHVFV